MKTALITGASRGIGLAIAEKLAEKGYALFVSGRHRDTLEEAKRRLQARYSVPVYVLEGDVSNTQTVSTLFRDEIWPHTDRLDVLVNNAGIAHVGLLQDMTEEQWNQVMDVNVKSVFNCTKQVLPSMFRAGSGSIINISSVWGVSGASMEVAYSASKGAVNAFTKALAREVAPSGIRVNAIACGVIDTSMNGHLSAEEKTDLENQIGLERFGRPEEVASLAAFLACEEASYLTGQVITLDGGFI